MPFDYQKVRDILACPKCRVSLMMHNDLLVCANADTRCSYPIVDGIPRLLSEEAGELDVEEWNRAMQQNAGDGPPGKVSD